MPVSNRCRGRPGSEVNKCQVLNSPFGLKSLQNYNDSVLTVTRLNGDMNDSLAAVRLPIRKPGPHNSCGPIGTLK